MLQHMHIGKRIVLPSTFIGSARNLRLRYQDAMAIVRTYGKPDLFITFTCNPQWSEIVASLKPGQTSSDRPDLIARVFQLKLKELLREILERQIFGKVLAHMYVIEFQKRGLPHAHILLILSPGDKPTSPAHYNSFVSAEIPDPMAHPRLHSIVARNMIHGPCGSANPIRLA